MSKVEVNEIDKQNGSTLTIGGSGTTVQLGTGATQTGFGRTGTVDWQTGSIKTSTFTAVDGEGYFVDTSSGAVTVNLPAGTAGAIVAFSDYTRTFQNNALTISPNGSNKIGGLASSANLVTEGQTATFVFVDATEGWINIQETSNSITGTPPFIAATGGNATVTSSCGDFKTHIFTSPGTFQVTNQGTACGSTKLDYFIVAGGGGGGGDGAGGGGAGGFRLANSYSIPAPTMSPLANPSAVTATLGSFPIVVGGGGTAGTYSPATQGGDGVASSGLGLSSAGGGGGGSYIACSGNGRAGGSGGGGTRAGVGGAGNTPSTTPEQGKSGGPGGPSPNGDGGGGAGAVGGDSPGNPIGGAGGIGSFVADAFIGPTAPSYGTPGPVSSTRYFSGGGGGGGDQVPSNGAAGGSGGGGAGGPRPNPSNATAGTDNTGGGGGGSGVPGNAGIGGSGIVMIRYKFQ